MKLKARDIIAGWPRGRSNMSMHSAEEAFHSITWRAWCGGWTLEDKVKATREALRNLFYHADQQEMTDEYRKDLHDRT